MTPAAASAPAVERPPVHGPLALRWRATVVRPAAESIQVAALLRFEPPPEGARSTASLVSIRRVCRHGKPFEVRIDASESAWADVLEQGLIALLKSGDQSAHLLHKDLDLVVLKVLDDAVVYASFFSALQRAAAEGRPRAEDDPGVAPILRAFVAPWVGDAEMEVRHECRAAPAAPRPENEAAPSGGGMRVIPFAGSLQGPEARSLAAGMVIAPERDRTRRYVVTDVSEGNELGTVTIFCRSEESPPEVFADGLFTVASVARVPLAREGDDRRATEGSAAPSGVNPLLLVTAAAAAFTLLYVLLGWAFGG